MELKKEQAEFERLVKPIRPKLLQYAYKIDPTAREDILQEALFQAWRAFSQYKRERPFEAWMMRILQNCGMDHLRRKSVRAHISSNYILQDDLLGAPCDELEAVGRREILQNWLRHLKRQIPEHALNAVLLCARGKSYEEISKITNVRIGTVRSRIHRGRRWIQERCPPPSL